MSSQRSISHYELELLDHGFNSKYNAAYLAAHREAYSGNEHLPELDYFAVLVYYQQDLEGRLVVAAGRDRSKVEAIMQNLPILYAARPGVLEALVDNGNDPEGMVFKYVSVNGGDLHIPHVLDGLTGPQYQALQHFLLEDLKTYQPHEPIRGEASAGCFPVGESRIFHSMFVAGVGLLAAGAVVCGALAYLAATVFDSAPGDIPDFLTQIIRDFENAFDVSDIIKFFIR